MIKILKLTKTITGIKHPQQQPKRDLTNRAWEQEPSVRRSDSVWNNIRAGEYWNMASLSTIFPLGKKIIELNMNFTEIQKNRK